MSALMSWNIIIFFSLIVFFTAAVFTWLIRIHALRKSILDVPNDRSLHIKPMPRGGGIAIVLTFFGTVFLLALQNFIPENVALALIGGGLLIAGVGYWDDVAGVSSQWRALIQFLGACWALYWLGGFPILTIAQWKIELGWFGIPLAIVGIMWLTNLYNFMDGIDGFAGMEGVFVSLAGSLILWIAGAPNFAIVGLLLAASIGGFLLWNWPPAKIFMGDVGSGTLGFIFAVILIASENILKISILFWLILLAIFIVDTTFTLLLRIRNKKPIHIAHREHVYQRLVSRGFSHLQVTMGGLLVNLFILLPVAYLTYIQPTWSMLYFILTFFTLVIVWYPLHLTR